MRQPGLVDFLQAPLKHLDQQPNLSIRPCRAVGVAENALSLPRLPQRRSIRPSTDAKAPNRTCVEDCIPPRAPHNEPPKKPDVVCEGKLIDILGERRTGGSDCGGGTPRTQSVGGERSFLVANHRGRIKKTPPTPPDPKISRKSITQYAEVFRLKHFRGGASSSGEWGVRGRRSTRIGVTSY